jgi:hypothetical protein
MKLSPRVKLALIASIFALPMAASVIVYVFSPPQPTANYGELLLPPRTLPAEFRKPFGERWLLMGIGGADCAAACMERVDAMQRVRLALGREAPRVVAVTLAGPEFAKAGVAVDEAHIYLADPHGNVMMRWPASPDKKRMLEDLKRLLKASRIG